MNDDVKQTEDTSANCPESRPWYREPVNAKDIHRGCLCCSTAAELAPMEMVIAVGFGFAAAFKGEDCVYDENTADEYLTVADIESLAKRDPEHDWQIRKYGPMHGETFQRQGDARWVCIESNQGFA